MSFRSNVRPGNLKAFQLQTEDRYEDIGHFDLVLQASLEPGRIYYHAFKVGAVVNRDMNSNQWRYVVFDFSTKELPCRGEEKMGCEG